MKRLIRTMIIVILLSPMLMGMAEAAEVQYIKINPHELDKNYNAHRVEVNITTDVIGNLAYIEEYYSVDSYGQPKPYGGIRHEEDLTTNTISFDIMRPRDKEGKEYTSIKAKVIMDNKAIFEEWIPVGSTYKLNNLKRPAKVATPRPVSNITNKPTILEKPNSAKNKTAIVDKNTPETPGFGIIMATIVVLIIYAHRKINIRR